MDKQKHKEARALVFPRMCTGWLMEVMSALAGIQNDKPQPQSGESSAREPQNNVEANQSFSLNKNFSATCNQLAYPTALPTPPPAPQSQLGGYYLGSSLSSGIEMSFLTEWKSGMKGLKCLGMSPKREGKRAILSNCNKMLLFASAFYVEIRTPKSQKYLLAYQMYF